MSSYPDYKEIQNGRERRRRQEVEGGRQRVLRDMANGLVERLCTDYKLDKDKVQTRFNDPDPRNWTLAVTVPGGKEFEESFFKFPSPEFVTTMMLIGK